MKKCPFCAEEIQDEAIKCKHCGGNIRIVPGLNTPRPVSLIVGAIMVFLGFVLCLYGFNLDTSVEVPVSYLGGQQIGGGRVNNLGLMQNRQNYLMFGAIALVGGVVLSVMGYQLAPKSPATPVPPATPSPQSEQYEKYVANPISRGQYACFGGLGLGLAVIFAVKALEGSPGLTVLLSGAFSGIGGLIGWNVWKDRV